MRATVCDARNRLAISMPVSECKPSHQKSTSLSVMVNPRRYMHSMELVVPPGVETEKARSKGSNLHVAIGTGVMCRWDLPCICGFEQNVPGPPRIRTYSTHPNPQFAICYPQDKGNRISQTQVSTPPGFEVGLDKSDDMRLNIWQNVTKRCG